jgi:DeoR/GlpR family transcriptional regulator of sugar metabolism
LRFGASSFVKKDQTLLNRERQQKILELLETNPAIRVSDLSKSLRVSEANVRRDLDGLSDLGRIERIHGGAVLAESAGPEPPVILRGGEMIQEKRRIGQAAASLIGDGETVFIGSGTTTLEVARCLIGRKNLTVATNALTVVNVLAQDQGISVISTGGLLRRSELSFVGYIVQQSLNELRPHKVIIGMRSISLDEGMTNDYLPEVSTDRMIIKSAPEVILVADHTKFGKLSAVFVAPLTVIHKLVTDSLTPLDFVTKIRSLGIDVLQV